MGPSAPRKPHIALSDYNYRRDIQNRLLLTQFNATDVEILEEILNGSLSFSLKALADTLNVSLATISHTVKQLEQIELLKVKGDQAIIDKEMRKYFEMQLERFQSNFEPNLDFFQRLLNKIPIEVLPNWYAIPRTSDNIFLSIVERHLITPKIFEKHLEEIKEDHSLFGLVLQELFSPPNFCIEAEKLKAKFNLTAEQHTELILLLEFEFAGCSRFVRDGSGWKELLTPFFEWKEYLQFLYKNSPQKVADPDAIKRYYPHDFGFVEELTIRLEESFSSVKKRTKKQERGAGLTERMQELLQALFLMYKEEGELKFYVEEAKKWLKLPIQERAISLYTAILARLREGSDKRCPLFNDRDVREVEKSLKRIHHSGWVDLESFIRGMTVPIGTTQSVYLRTQGRRSQYKLPHYNTGEIDFIRNLLTNEFMEAGFVTLGTYGDNKICLNVTPFGRMTLGE